jgi:hypothetical protein
MHAEGVYQMKWQVHFVKSAAAFALWSSASSTLF